MSTTLASLIDILGKASTEPNFQYLLDKHQNIDLVIADCTIQILDTATTMSKIYDNSTISSILISYDSSAKSSKIQALPEANMPSDKQTSFDDIVAIIKKYFEGK
jgi:hypothetical protein